jgi:crossover junction endodeoxyribonuclease RuvC
MLDFLTFDFRLLPLQSLRMATGLRPPARIIGIDPGLNVTGYGVVEWAGIQARLVEAGVIRCARGKADNLPARLQSLFETLREVMEEFRPQMVCLEEIYSHSSYPRTSILMGHARGVICLAARLARIPVVNFSAKRIKQSVTGNGNASKTQVQRAVQQYFSLAREPHPPDVADALAAALCYANTLGRGVGRQAIRWNRERLKAERGSSPAHLSVARTFRSTARPQRTADLKGLQDSSAHQ